MNDIELSIADIELIMWALAVAPGGEECDALRERLEPVLALMQKPRDWSVGFVKET